MRITFTGAHSTGKTTLLNILKKENYFKNFTFIDEITRKVKKQGLKINEEGDDLTQNTLIDCHLQILKTKNCVTDRCILDVAVYTDYLFKHNKVSRETKQRADVCLSLNIDKYDKIFYLEPEFEIEDDKVRSINKEFRDEIVEIFHNYISNFKIPVIRLTGTIRERLNKIYEECFNTFEGADIGIFLEDKRAKMPKVAYKGTSACFDLICIEDTIIPARGSAIVPNGLRIAVPNGYYLEFATRSGMGIKQNLRVHPGIIDSGYSGELSVKVFNLSDKEEIIKADKGCVQVKVVKIPEYRLRQITKEEFEEYQKNSIRGNNGFGSSDKSKN